MTDTRKFSIPAYDKIVERTFKEVVRLGIVKGGEYAGDVDRLANFRRNAEKNGVPMEVCWNIYASKHWDALQQYILDLSTGKKRPRAEALPGRIDDIIVYLLLFKAILAESDQAPVQRAPRKPRQPKAPATPPAETPKVEEKKPAKTVAKKPAEPKTTRRRAPAPQPAQTPPAGEPGTGTAPEPTVRRRAPVQPGEGTLV